MARNRGTQLTASKGGLNETMTTCWARGAPAPWASGRAERLCAAAGARATLCPPVAPGAAVWAAPWVGLLLPASLLCSVPCLPLCKYSTHEPPLFTGVAACPTPVLVPNSWSTAQAVFPPQPRSPAPSASGKDCRGVRPHPGWVSCGGWGICSSSWSFQSSQLLNMTEDLKELLFMWLWLLTSIILEIKTEKS